jgi:hypothetical protein
MKNIRNFVCTLTVLGALIVPVTALSQVTNSAESAVSFTDAFFVVPLMEDYDPLVEQIVVTVAIQEIRALDTMDLLSDPDFYVKVSINDNTFKSPVWREMKYVEEPNWAASCEVPKDTEFVDIVIELWDKNPLSRGQLCDISPESYGLLPKQSYTAELTYSIATGLWSGDDSTLWDLSGYGRLNGCDDNSIYTNDRDAEVFFTISQNDFDGDGLPYWLETNIYNTSPVIDNRGEDADGDGIPIEWEHRFGLFYFPWHDDDDDNESQYYLIYDPNKREDHATLDPDKDGLTNCEEYKTWQWGSDPSRKDIFVEIDQMELGPNGEGAFVPTQAFDLIRNAHARQNIVWHIDDGRLGGGELIPFKEVLEENDTRDWYWDYFMHGDAQNWRRGVFRWCVVSYNYSWAKGFTFGSNINGSHAVDCFFLSTKYHEMRAKIFPIIDGLHRGTFNREMNRAYVYGGAMMHETGHMLNIQAPGFDVSNSIWPWQVNYWRFASYQSCCNYRYIYRGVVDYSDGSRGKNDFNDWANMDLTYFNPGGGHW